MEHKSTWINENGEKCIDINNMVDKIQSFTELDFSMIEFYLTTASDKTINVYVELKKEVLRLSRNLLSTCVDADDVP